MRYLPLRSRPGPLAPVAGLSDLFLRVTLTHGANGRSPALLVFYLKLSARANHGCVCILRHGSSGPRSTSPYPNDAHRYSPLLLTAHVGGRTSLHQRNMRERYLALRYRTDGLAMRLQRTALVHCTRWLGDPITQRYSARNAHIRIGTSHYILICAILG